MTEPSISPHAEAFRSFVTSVLALGSALLRHGDATTAPLGQSSARWRVLLRIARGDDSVPAIARRTGYSRQSVQRLADGLVNDGLATFRTDDSDRRTKHIDLTDTGVATFEALEAHFDAWSRPLVSSIGLDELETLTSSLDRIREIMQAQTTSQP